MNSCRQFLRPEYCNLAQKCGVRGHVRALELADMSASRKAATCRRTPKHQGRGESCLCLEDWRRRKTAVTGRGYFVWLNSMNTRGPRGVSN